MVLRESSFQSSSSAYSHFKRTELSLPPGSRGGMTTVLSVRFLFMCVIQASVGAAYNSQRAPAVCHATFSGVLTQVTAASRAVGAALEPVHNVFQVSTMAAPLAPHKQSLHHMVAHCTYTGTLVAPRGEMQGACQRSVHVRVYYSV